MKSCILVLTVLAAICFTGCGGGTMSSSTTTYTISASVTGLASGETLQVQDNNTAGNQLAFSSNSTQTFAAPYPSGSSYTVTVAAQPTGQTCTLGSNASGTITSNITVAVTCASVPTYTISAAVTGLATGTTLDLTDNLSDQLSFTSNTTQTFPTAYQSGAPYTVSVAMQPLGQTCTLSSNATGTITSSITVTATCAPNTGGPFSISVAVTGLASGATLAMQDNNGTGNELQFTTNTTETFLGTYVSGSSYTVSVFTQPANQNCTLSSNAAGTITSNITVTATCVSAFTLSASVAGLASGATLKLQDNNTTGNQLSFTTNTTQAFAATYVSGASYSVTVFAQPTGQTCTLASNANGIITANTTVAITCTSGSPSFTISAAVTGLASGATLTLLDNASDVLTFTSNTTLPFATAYVSGTSYTVSVATQPSGQTCALSSNATGTITANVTVTATCTNGGLTYSIGGTISGLTASGLTLTDNGGNSLTVSSGATSFTFTTKLPSGSNYDVEVSTQPSGETCTPSANTGTVGNANITTVVISCATVPTYSIGGTISGLTASGLTLTNNGGNSLTVSSGATSFTFTTKLPSGSAYDVEVSTQPSGETCTPTHNTGTVGNSNVTTVVITCVPSSGGPTISVAVSGLTGTVEFQDDQGATLTFTSNGTQTFSNTYASGAAYTVSVTSQPLTESCIPTYSTGTMGASGVTIFATCQTGAARTLGKVSDVSTITCQGAIANGVCQQMTVSCPDVPSVQAYVKTNTPTGTPLGVASYGTGTDGNGLYESPGIFTYGKTAVQNVLDAGFITVQISWGSPFNNNQPNGWVQGPGGVLAAACNYATVVQWIHDNIGTKTPNLPYCATGNSGGAGAVAYTLSQYPNELAMAEVTSGPPPGRLDWGCGCTEGKLPVQCGTASTLGTCFGKTDGAVWDGAYSPNTLCSTAASNGGLPPGGLSFFLGDSVEAPGANYDFPKTFVNLVFGSADSSSAIPIAQDWFNNITTSKAQVCVPGGEHSMADTLPGADQIANDLINLCKLQ